MFYRKNSHRDMADIHVYTARKLSSMAGSLETLAKTFDQEISGGRSLSREDGLAALQMAGAMVCGDCSKCNLYSDSEKEDSYYLYYLLRSFEQIVPGDMRASGRLCGTAEPEFRPGDYESDLEKPVFGKPGYGGHPIQGTGHGAGRICQADGSSRRCNGPDRADDAEDIFAPPYGD